MRRSLIALVGLVFGCELTAELGTYPQAESETASMSSTETGIAATGDESGTSGEEAGVCAIDGSETPCRICLEHLCCTQLENCNEESGCFCMLDCLLESDPVTCAMTCTPGPAYFQLIQCRAMSCATVCD